MKTMRFLTLLATLLAVIGCSQFSEVTNHDSTREIASEIKAPLSLSELMTIESTSVVFKDGDFTASLSTNFTWPEGIKYEFILDDKLSSDTAFKIVPEIRDSAFKVKIYHSLNAKSDRAASTQLDRFLDLIFKQKLVSQFSFYELYFNARAQDLNALHILTKLRNEALLSVPKSKIGNIDVNNYALENINKYTNTLLEFDKAQRAHNKIIKAQTNSRKLAMDTLDKVSEDQQFRTLVAKNDRKGATALLRKYLPWELMPPVEKEFWEGQLSIIAEPLPVEKRVIVYRGINDDLVQSGYKAGKKLATENAILEQNMFLMSTMLTKNQGSWNRRLRSLTSMYDKFIATDNLLESEMTKASRLTVMFRNHSVKPQGSPFLSFTPRFSVSNTFGNKRNTVYILDPRLISYNFTSKFQNEVEYLMPLMTFPEDLGAVYDVKLDFDRITKLGLSPDEYLRNSTLEKLKRIHGAENAAAIWKSINKNTLDFFDETLDFFGSKTPIDPTFLKIFKKVAGVPLEILPPGAIPDTNLKCVDMMKDFWK